MSARLACLIHAANVHSEPGSNPLSMYSGDRRLTANDSGANKSAPETNAPSIVDAIGPGGPTRFKNTGFVPAYVGESR